jgi:hypothetical protein
MKGSIRLASVFLALVIVFTALAPAQTTFAAAKDIVKVEFQNKTGVAVALSLSGPHSYYFYLNTGKTKVDVIPGKYTYSYTVCGQTKTGKFNAKNDGANLTLPKCSDEKGSGESKITFKNTTGASLYVYLSGPKSYTFYLSTGTTKVDVMAGKYTIKYHACDQDKSGKLNAKNNTNYALAKCKEEKSKGEVKVTIKNNTGGSLYIYLSGPHSYYFSFSSGTSKMEIIGGSYSYTAYGCGASISGTKNLKGNSINWTFWCY